MSESNSEADVCIAGTGSYVPERVLTNEQLAAMVETSDEWIVTRTGIRERHIAAEGEHTSHMASHAARRALEQANTNSMDELVSMVVAQRHFENSTTVMRTIDQTYKRLNQPK